LQIKKVLLVIGTRPEAIKLAPIADRFLQLSGQFQIKIVATGQHREMLAQAIESMGLTVDVDLDVMIAGQNLATLTSSIVRGLQSQIDVWKPDLILVQGDTTSALCGALVGLYNHIKVAHVEAGLRTFNRESPFPEEINRELISRLADWHFAPTNLAKENLVKEGIAPDRILVSGNTVIDALLQKLNEIEKDSELKASLEKKISNVLGNDWGSNGLVLITGHRRESFGEQFENICLAILDLSKYFPNIKFVYPVHLNPQVQKTVRNYLEKQENIYLLPPLDYEAFLYVLSKSKLVLTDSGGIQEEAPSLHKPVLVMRDNTERPEGLTAGVMKLVGTHRNSIFEGVRDLLSSESLYHSMTTGENPYGDGFAASRIVDFLATK